MDGQIADQLNRTWARHAETQAQRVAIQEQTLVKLLASTLDEDAQRLAAAEAHKLAGSLGSFGMEEGSALAAELEDAWKSEDPWSLDAAALARQVAKLRRLLQERAAAHEPAAAHSETPSATDNTDVLLVDDDNTFASYVQVALAAQHQLTWLPDGNAALKAITDSDAPLRPRLILLDIEMPGLDGLKVLERLAEAGITRQCRVVMLTRRTMAEDIVKARRLGAFDFLAKPLTSALLLDRVDRALELTAAA